MSKPVFARFRPGLIAIAAWASLMAAPISTAVHAANAALETPAGGLPSLGGAGEMPLAQERKLGDSIARQLWRDPDLLDDPLLQSYVDGVFAALIAAARERGELDADMAERFAWRAFIGKDRTVNAFALPGGYFGVHAGLLKMTVTRDEFASVIAHEISHVTQRHISRNIAKQTQQQPLLLAATLLGVLAARSADAVAATVYGSQAAGAQLQLNFSREMEREADRVGFNVLTQAGFEPQGMRSMFERLQNATRLADSGSFPYLRSHPLTTERIAEVQSRVQLDANNVMLSAVAGPRAGPGAPQGIKTSALLASDPAIGPGMHTLMSARAKVLADNSLDQLRIFATEGNAATVEALPAERRLGALYTSMLAHHRLREFDEAWTRFHEIKPLLVSDSIEYVAIEIAANELSRDQAIAQGQQANWQSALAHARGPASPHGQWRPSVMAWSATQINAGLAPRASERLQNWVAEHPGDTYAWRLLAKAWEAQGRNLRSVEARAQAHKLELDLSGALERLKTAQRMTRNTAADHVDASIIDAKAREIASALRDSGGADRPGRPFAVALTKKAR